MAERFWFVSVGPFDEGHVIEWVEGVADRCPGSPEVELIDHRQWYARAIDADTVRDALVALRVGIAGAGVANDVRSSVAGLVSDMETWLKREFDAGQD